MGVKFANVPSELDAAMNARTLSFQGQGGTVTLSTLEMNLVGATASSLKRSLFAGLSHNPILVNKANYGPQNDFARGFEGWGGSYVNVSFNKRKDVGTETFFWEAWLNFSF